MAIKVNRPPEIQLPKELASMGIEVIDFFEHLGRYNLQMFTRSGGATDSLAAIENSTQNSFNSIAQQLRKELDGLPEFTIDTTGFTVDTTFITADKVIA